MLVAANAQTLYALEGFPVEIAWNQTGIASYAAANATNSSEYINIYLGAGAAPCTVEYPIYTQPCLIQIPRADVCLLQRNSWGSVILGMQCTDAQAAAPSCTNIWSRQIFYESLPCVEINRTNSCEIANCVFQYYAVETCYQLGFGAYSNNYKISNYGLQCDDAAYCDANGKCIDARDDSCESALRCTPSSTLGAGTYAVQLVLGTVNATVESPGINYTVLPFPELVYMTQLGSPGAAFNATFVDPNGLAPVYFYFLSAPDMLFVNSVPSIAPPLSVPAALRVGVAFAGAPSGEYLMGVLAQTFMYIPSPTALSVFPRQVVAFAQTAIQVVGANFYSNYTQCMIDGVYDPSIMRLTYVSPTVVACTLYERDTQPNAQIQLAITNDFGATATAPLLVQILGSCATIKPNSIARGDTCVCAPGAYDVAYACLPCPVDTYQPLSAQAACIPCDSTETAPSGSVSAAACICKDGYASSAGGDGGVRGGPCIPCPLGLVCANGTATVMPGYWRANSEIYTPVIACPGVCAGGAGTGTCVHGREGPVCSVCSPGYAGATDSTCQRCFSRGGSVAAIIAMACAVALLFYVMIRVTTNDSPETMEDIAAMKSSDADGTLTSMLKIMFNYAQILFYIGNLYVGWSQSTMVMFSVLAPVSISPSMTIFQCATRAQYQSAQLYYNTVVATMIMPALIVVGMALLFLGAAFIVPCKGWVVRMFTLTMDSYLRCTLIVLYAVHPIIANELLRIFRCDAIPGVGLRLRANHNVDCAAAEYQSLRAAATVYLLVYVLGGLVLGARRMYLARGDILNLERAQWLTPRHNRYMYFARGYKDSVFMWEFVIMMRKLLVVATVVLASPVLQLTWSAAVVVASMGLTLRIRPYIAERDNELEIAALSALALSILLGMHIAVLGADTSISAPVMTLLLIVNLAMVGYAVQRSRRRIAKGVKRISMSLVKSRSNRGLGGGAATGGNMFSAGVIDIDVH
jgi:hypothetical protein